MIEQNTPDNQTEAPIPVAQPTSPQIIVSGKGGKLPLWFYLLFVVVLILFIGMTSLIVGSLGK
ncbi:hypothetical protein HZB96_01035 [Candidatus Gottesmanbacteria bacterium]|nr:hypothetical protein [Candidatus Gottesmanbacteria bacterium]MBI5452310.1 hypothetical protein [Candidatus Gottesmanbacteria bacterium]